VRIQKMVCHEAGGPWGDSAGELGDRSTAKYEC
jgi:hypothetical protein